MTDRQLADSLTRRRLLRTTGSLSLLALAGCPSPGEPSTAEIEPGWTAAYEPYTGIDFGGGPDDTASFSATTLLRYEGATWSPNGNPAPEDADADGCWQHTFVLTSSAFAFFHGNVADGVSLENALTVRTDSTDLSISARRDADLYGFFDADAVADELRDAPEVRERLASDPREAANVNVSRLKRKVERRAEDVGEIGTVVSFGLGLMVAGLSLASGGVTTPLGLFALFLGIATTGFAFIAAVVSDLLGIDSHNRDSVDYDEGFTNHVPDDYLGPVSGHYVMFDVCAPPAEGEGGNFDVSVELTENRRFEHADPTWTIHAPGRAPPDDETTAQPIETARIAGANFQGRENEETEVYEGTRRYKRRQQPRPGIAGPFIVEPGREYTYHAGDTLLGGHHVQRYEWETYLLSEQITFDDTATLTKSLDELRADLDPTATDTGVRGRLQFDASGTYLVVVEADDGEHAAATADLVIAGEPPKASIAGPSEVSAGLSHRFDASESTDPDGDDAALAYYWVRVPPLLGLPEVETGVEPRLSFDATGSHLVLLLVVDESGAIDVDTTMVEATEGGTAAWPTYQFDPANTGVRPDATGPTGPVATAWTHPPENASPVFRDASPVASRDTVYLAAPDGVAYALDPADGSVRWTFRLDRSAVSTPVLAGSTLYVSDGTTLHALDVADGTERWSASVAGTGNLRSPALVDGTLYGTTDDTAFALGTETGTVQWRTDLATDTLSQPAVADGRLYAGGNNDVYAVDAGDGSVAWSYTSEPWRFSAPTVAGGTAYVGSQGNAVHAIDAASGDRRWRTNVGSTVFSSPAVDDTHLYLGDYGGTVRALDRADGSTAWTFGTGDRVRASPVVAGDTVYVASTDRSTYALDTTDGTERWSLRTDAPVVTAGSVAHDSLYTIDENGVLRCVTDAE